MKKSLLFMLLTLMGHSMMAKPVEPEKAMQVAKNFMAQYVKGADQMEATVVYTHPMPKSGQPAMYAVNIGNMFVLVSADDIAHPVLGYSLSRPWPTSETQTSSSAKEQGKVVLPSQVTSYLNDLAAQIEAASGSPYIREASPSNPYNSSPNIGEVPEGQRGISSEWRQLLSLNSNLLTTTNLPDSVGPLLTTTWDQGQYYNALCPEDANGPAGHVYTGCVATAMAQIINYWGYSIHGRGTHSYNSNYGALSVNYDSATYDYAHMPAALTATSTPQEVNAVATLMRDCGVAANMGYGPSESGAYDIDARAGMINFFRLSPNLSYAEKTFFADSVWENMLRTDISINHPVFYSGRGTGGHSFVCDGYNQDGYFHFNFGWSGYSDGWYLTSAVNPAGLDFNSDQSAILGIIPDNTGNVILGQMAGTSTFTVDEPLEFYHLLGHNQYVGFDYANSCSNNVTFISADSTKHMVVDIMEFEDQNLTINDGNGVWLRNFSGGGDNDLSPLVSTVNAISITYSGNFYYAGFKLSVSQEADCRMVSNITSSIAATTVHLTWTENGGATQWQIEYGVKNFELGEGTVYNTATNTVTFENLEKFTEYDFYIRSICDDNQYGPWNKVTLMVEAPYWQDIVTSQPEGYYYNATTNTIEITTPEALAWWAQNPNSTSVKILADIDLGENKWRPIPMSAEGIEIDGEGHSIQNLFIVEPSAAAFFQWAHDCTIKNLVFRNSKVYGTLRSAVLFSHSAHSNTVVNVGMDRCFVKGTDIVGTFAGETNSSTYKNCYTKGVVVDAYRTCGLFTGTGNSDFLNCYADGRAIMHIDCYNSGIMAYKHGGNVRRCYSVDMQYGVIGSNQGGLCIDTSSFWHNDNNFTLRSPISFDGTTCNTLLEALNKEVIALGDCELNTWITEDTSGLPVFGPKFQTSCQNVSGLTAQNVVDNNELKVLVNWNDNQVSSWQIKIIENGLSDSDICYSNVVQNPTDTISGLIVGKTYEIYVRSVCNEDTGGWGNSFVLHFDKPYWTEVVNEIPNGFNEDDSGNVTISTAEGLAWLAKTLGNCIGKTIVLANDIDLSQYRWNPITFAGFFDGGNHKISNIYVNEPNKLCCGLIGTADNAIIKNIQMVGGTVTGRVAIGGLVGNALNNCTIDNCHSSVNVFSNQQYVGSLIGSVSSSNVVNCSSSGNVHGNESMGGLIGYIYGGSVINCYSSGNIYINHSSSVNRWYNGGLIGYFAYSNIHNCYTIGTIETESTSRYVGKIIGCPEYNSQIQYVYAQDNVNPELGLIGLGNEETFNMAQFHHNNDSLTLLTPINIDNENYSDLLDALNAWVALRNDHYLKTWTLDDTTGYPILGDYYDPSCFNPEDLLVSNATLIGDTTIRTKLSWTQIGMPDHWEILYVASEHNKEDGTIVSVDTNSYILTDIPIGQPLDFYVRAVCGNNDVSNWCNPVTYIPDKLRWTEVVTSQPEGYTVDAEGNVYISSAEGLAWLSSVVNGLNEVAQQTSFWNKKIYVLTDIDLSLYRWSPIGATWEKALVGCEIVGNNHIVNGLYCNELADNMGLLGVFNNGKAHDLRITLCSIWGEENTGAVAGQTSATDIYNCIVSGNIYGIQNVGGIVGYHHGNSIKNACFQGNAVVRRDITKTNTIGGYIGGICGVPLYDTIVNCYAVSEIGDDCAYPGIITGSGGLQNLVSNCYYKDYASPLPITSETSTTSNNSSFSGSGTTWTLNTPPYVNGEFRTDLVDGLNAWVDANNTDGQYHFWAVDSTGENNGYPVFAAIPCTPATGNDSITVCDSYSWHGTVYTADAVLTDTLSTIDGCDSIVSHHLFVHHSTTGDTTATACDSFSWYEHIDLTESADTLTHTFTGANIQGCDSIVTLHLTINYSSTGDTTATACDNFTWWNTNYTSSTNTPIHVYTNAAGCDSTVTLHLTINHSTSSILTDTACEAYFWDGEWRYISGQYTDTTINAAGCDSITTLNLTINNPVHTATTVTACDSYTWQETVITTSGTYHYTHTDAHGCTQDDTLYLIINYSSTGDTTATACDNFTWWNTNYTSSTNTPIHIYTNAAGCDSTVTLHLTVNYSSSSVLTDTACEAYFWDGEWRYVSGQYSDTTTNAVGCDSITTLNLTINNPVHTATTVTACDSYTWQEAVITTSGTYHYTHTDAHGCTQDDTLYLTINHNDTVIVDEEVCDSITWYGTTYTASAYGIQYLTVPNTVGCDSIFFLDLTVNYTTYGEMSAVSCDSYEWDWNGAVYTASGDYTHRDTVNMNSQFCDSVLTLHLTINHSATSDTTATACDLFVWYGNMGYDVSGNYEHRWWNVTADGCDSILTLHLTINHSAETTVTDTAEGNYTWNGTTYTESGTYTWTGETVEGCDSSVTLILTINQVGIFDIQNSEFKINIFPNPTTDLLTIDADDILSVELFDLNGRRIFSSEVDSSPFTVHLSPFTLSAGSYLLRIHTRQGTAVQHVILK